MKEINHNNITYAAMLVFTAIKCTCIYIHSSIAPSDTFEHKFMKISECPQKNLLEEFKSSISSFFSV